MAYNVKQITTLINDCVEDMSGQSASIQTLETTDLVSLGKAIANAGLTEGFFGMMKDALEQLFAEMLDPAVPFSRTTVEKNCEYCDFKVICGRTSND